MTNALGIFTGILDPPLTQAGIDEALVLGRFLRSQLGTSSYDVAFTSLLQRATVTLDLILSTLSPPAPPIITSAALNERDYGELNGRDKRDVAREYGEELTNAWRRSYAAIPPGTGAESLEMTCARVMEFYVAEIKVRLMRGEKVLVVSHGNTLRALVMRLEGLGEEEVRKLQLGTAAMRTYRLGGDGEVLERELFLVNGMEGTQY